MNTLFTHLVDTHIQQDYGTFSNQIPLDHLIKKYAVFPNESIYLVDCLAAQFEPLTNNFMDIISMDVQHKNDLTLLYEHVHPSNLEGFLSFTQKIVNCGFDKSIKFKEEEDFFMSIYLTHTKKVILKSTCLLYYDTNNTMRYTLGKLIDVTNLIPFQHFSYKFVGPACDRLYDRMLQENEGNSLLSSRELEVLDLIGKKKDSREIGEVLFISKNTVDTHRRNIIKKLNCRNSNHAYLEAKNMGLL